MKLTKWFGHLIFYLLLIFAGLAPALAQRTSPDPIKKPTIQKAPQKFIISISTTDAYKAVLVASGANQPRGLGAFPTRNRLLFNTEGDSSLWYFDGGPLKLISSGTLFHASRYYGGAYMGDDNGTIYQLLEGPVFKTLATMGGGNITGLDVDRPTGDIYFINANLYKLPKGKSVPVLVAALGFSSWGVGVRGNYLYISDFGGNTLWRMPKKGGSMTFYASLKGPTDVVADTAGNLFIAEFTGGSVAFIPAKSKKVKRIAWGMSAPYYLGIDSLGDVYVSDLNADMVWMLKKR